MCVQMGDLLPHRHFDRSGRRGNRKSFRRPSHRQALRAVGTRPSLPRGGGGGLAGQGRPVRQGRPPGPTVDPNTGERVGRFVGDGKGNNIVEPAGGETVGSRDGIWSETRYPNGSPYQQQHGPHPGTPYPHGHGFGAGPGRNQRGPSLDPLGNKVHPDAPAAHWPIKQ
jgi:hypothetical protein